MLLTTLSKPLSLKVKIVSLVASITISPLFTGVTELPGVNPQRYSI